MTQTCLFSMRAWRGFFHLFETHFMSSVFLFQIRCVLAIFSLGSNPQLSFIPTPYFLTPVLSSSLPPSHSAFHVFFCVAAVFCYSISLLLSSPSCCWKCLWISLSTELCFPQLCHQKLSAPLQLLVSSPVPSCPNIHPWCWTWPIVAPPVISASILGA